MSYKRIVIFLLLVTLIYCSGYILFREDYSKQSSVGTRYINLYRENKLHVVLHYLFYPALWTDYRLTGQEYSFSSYEEPFWIFTK